MEFAAAAGQPGGGRGKQTDGVTRTITLKPEPFPLPPRGALPPPPSFLSPVSSSSSSGGPRGPSSSFSWVVFPSPQPWCHSGCHGCPLIDGDIRILLRYYLRCPPWSVRVPVDNFFPFVRYWERKSLALFIGTTGDLSDKKPRILL